MSKICDRGFRECIYIRNNHAYENFFFSGGPRSISEKTYTTGDVEMLRRKHNEEMTELQAMYADVQWRNKELLQNKIDREFKFIADVVPKNGLKYKLSRKVTRKFT